MYGVLTSLPRALAAALLVIAGGGLVSCSSPAATPTRQTEPSAEPTDAHVERIETADGVGLDARLYPGNGPRLAIFMHGYGDRQQAWVPTIEAIRDELGAAALTFDFRGHGGSDEAPVETKRLVEDVSAAVAFARDRGYTSIVLVGASMGGTAAIVVAAGDRDLAGVIALSAPAQFGELDALDVVAHVDAPLALLASSDDVSAADSLRLLREEADLPTTRSWLYEGEAHGTDLFASEDGPAVRQYVQRLLQEFWPSG